jgi:hypothetical protein
MAPPPKARLSALLSVLAVACGPGLTLTTVPTDAESVCYNVDECAQAGSYSWLQSCNAEALTLQQQSDASGCGSLYDAYYSCANSNYTCQGITPSFPGCDTQLTSLEACLNAATAESACAQYTAKLASCPPESGTQPPGSPIVSPCSLSLQCQAQCYLSYVSNLCNPGLTELSAFSSCANACPP